MVPKLSRNRKNGTEQKSQAKKPLTLRKFAKKPPRAIFR
jgi:hypothetical protein